MKKAVITSSIASVIFGASALFAPFTLTATAPAHQGEECVRELLLSYFPEPMVKETLKKFQVPEDKWAGITKSLSVKEKDVIKRVEKKASEMTPNPLKDPQQRQAAVKLFRDTLLEVFSEAMKDNGVTDTSKFQAMLDDIQQQKAKKFAMCMEKQKAALKDKSTSDSGSDDDDDEDEDDDDDSDDDDDDDDSDSDDDDDQSDSESEDNKS